MSATTQLRLAATLAFIYGLLLVSGLAHQFQRTGSLPALVRGLAQPGVWIVLVVALLAAWGLWRRQAWAWWLGVAGAGWQSYRIIAAYLQGPSVGRLPHASTLLSLALLALILLLLLQRKARLGASR